MAQSLDSRPTVVDFREDSPWVQLAKAHWLDTKVRKAKPDVIKQQLWDPLEKENFSSRSLLILENLNILEKYAARDGCLTVTVRFRSRLIRSWLQISLADVHRRCFESPCSAYRTYC